MENDELLYDKIGGDNEVSITGWVDYEIDRRQAIRKNDNILFLGGDDKPTEKLISEHMIADEIVSKIDIFVFFIGKIDPSFEELISKIKQLPIDSAPIFIEDRIFIGDSDSIERVEEKFRTILNKIEKCIAKEICSETKKNP